MPKSKKRTLTVHRRGYYRREYIRKDGVKVSACYVPPATFKIKDRGAPGRGKKVIPIKGKMVTKSGKEYHTSLPAKQRHAILRQLVKEHGVSKVWHRLHAMVIMRKRTGGKAAEIFRRDRDWVAKTFGTKELTPKAAIRKWKSLPSSVRKRLMPERKKK